MKLFITNKKDFDNVFNDEINNRYKTSKEIHQEAFNILKKSLDINNSIPLLLMPSYKDDGVVLFDFVTKKEDVYFYEYNGTAS